MRSKHMHWHAPFRTRTIAPSLSVFLLFAFCAPLISQPNFTANDKVEAYDGAFRVGYNPGYHPGWNDQTLGDLAAGNPGKGVAGIGAKSVRQGLYFELLRNWGYGVRIPEVQHFQALGMGEMVGLLLGGANGGSEPFPPSDVRDMTEYCPGHPSDLFANLYEPIWDGGAGGSPYNENNYFAAYVWKTVNTYKDYIRFWEVWNEPGYDYTGDTGWRPAGDPAGNWWDANPDPCDYRLRTPIFHYVRMLRIAWEIVKTLDPDAYVCLSSPGYQSFLDAILRNTDNPADGSMSPDFPHQGGAYFDCLAYHAYPHFDGSTVLDPTPPAQFMRNSDRCADGVFDKRNYFQIVLKQRGYDGQTYPQKEYIVTEINLPRKSFGHPAYFGSAVAQRNFAMKAYMKAKIERIHQLHFYTLGERKKEADASFEFDLMGLYQNLDNVPPSSVQLNEEGIGLKTTAELLNDTEYDPVATAAMLAPDNVRARAFKRPDGKHVFALWAKTTTDLSEVASASYSFPLSLFFQNGQRFDWDWSQTGQVGTTGPLNLPLSGSPAFVVASLVSDAPEPAPEPHFSIAPNPAGAAGFSISFELAAPMPIELSLTDVSGRSLRTIFSGEAASGRQVFHCGENQLAPGLYFAVLKTPQGIFSCKIRTER